MPLTDEQTRERVEAAARAHTNLTMWGAVIALLESGLMYEGVSHATVQRVIAIAQRQQRRHLDQYDAALAKVTHR